jgi:hypothetical protein
MTEAYCYDSEFWEATIGWICESDGENKMYIKNFSEKHLGNGQMQTGKKICR